MGVSVDIQTFGVEIKNPDRERVIFLYPNSWECLVECKNQIEQALKGKLEFQWKIDVDKDIRAHTSMYQGQCYLHIRYWWKDNPTKRGVAFLEKDWEELKSHMKESAETSLGVSVVKQMLRERLHDIIRSQCEGCDNNWPSQMDHDCCLMEGKTTAEFSIDKAVTKVTAIDFIMLLAQEACKRKLILEMPHQTFKRIMLFHIQEIKQEVIESYDL